MDRIQFEWEEFNEEEKWFALFVKIGDGPWHLAKSTYNTEDKELIKECIRKSEKV